jgi:dTDP-4-amino-4,6-dideoxygalactose transaminase
VTVSVPFLDLSRSVAELRSDLDLAVAGVLDSGRFILGGEVAAFEAAFASYCGSGHAVGVASGTDAVAIALRALGIGPGDEVIVPANTCVPTVCGVEAAGATPVLADVDAATWTLDPTSAAAVVTDRTRAVVPVHLYGLCADVDALRALGLPIVEDAAQAHGAELRGRRAGSMGETAAFSFYPTKNLGALGDAGAVVARDPEVAELARSLRAYGERERYESVRQGWNSRLDELQAALLLVKLAHLDRWTARRRAIAARYDDAIRGTGLVAQLEPEGFLHARHLYVVRTPDRDAFRGRLAARGIETAVHYPRAIHGHPAYAQLGHEGLGESERLAAEVVSLPLYPELTDAEIDAVAAALGETGM